MKKSNLLLAAIALTLCSCAEQQPGVVAVTGGKIQGIVTDSMSIYKGIPFAAPPVGDLRWKAPQPVVPWDTIRQATQYAAIPMQGGQSPYGVSEDCLYLNVWTPAKSANDKLPVLVWIYGGGFSFGSTSEPTYDGADLASKGVVFVSIAYRVGQIGFFSHPELSAENPNHVSGNYGLLDQIAGLQWIQNNIAAFGGDPAKVTIFGESAGGISVSMLCASPLAKGLFRGAISQSGGSFGPTRPTTYPGENMKTQAKADDDCLKIAEQLGAKSIADLRALDAKEFLKFGMNGGGAWPIVDGYVIPGDQFELYEQGQYNDVAVLIGYNSDEGASFNFGGNSPENHEASVRQRYGKFADDLLKAYPMTDGKVMKTARDLMRDAAFGWQTWSWARLQAKTGKSDVYLYYFDQHPNNPNPDAGSPHGQDVGFVFQHLDGNNSSDSDVALSKAMGDYWTNFAKYGTPNAPDSKLPEWSKFTNDNPQAMYLTGPTPFVGPVPSEEALKVLDGYFAWRRTDEGKDWAK